MKKALFALLSLTIVSTAFAAAPMVEATFYASNPAYGAEALKTVMISNGKGANHIDDIEDAKYVTLQMGNETVTLKLFRGGTSKYSIKVDHGELNTSDADTLADVIDQL